MLEPSTSRTLRIYPIETITRCEVSGLLLFLGFPSIILVFSTILSYVILCWKCGIFLKCSLFRQVTDSSTFAFWSKSSVDIEPRRIRLQSNSYTTNTILDIVTAATVQVVFLVHPWLIICIYIYIYMKP